MKINFNELRKELKTELDTIVTSVYEGARKPTTYPYAVFEVRQTGESDGRTQCVFEVNIYGEDPADLEDYADDIEEMYDHYEYADTKIAFYTFKASRQPAPAEDRNVKRRRILIDLYLYSKEN